MTSQRVRQVIDRLARDGTVVASLTGTTHTVFPVAVSTAEGEALRDWVVRERATRTIEVGLGYGVSALYICAGLIEAGNGPVQHLAIDPNQASSFESCGLQLLDEAGLTEIVEHLDEDSQIALPQLLRDGRRFELAFVDGNHRFDGVFLDLAYLGHLLEPSRIVFLDDYQLPAVARAVSFFAENLGWALEEVSPVDEQHQWAVLRTSRHPDTRPYDHFVDF